MPPVFVTTASEIELKKSFSFTRDDYIISIRSVHRGCKQIFFGPIFGHKQYGVLVRFVKGVLVPFVILFDKRCFTDASSGSF